MVWALCAVEGVLVSQKNYVTPLARPIMTNSQGSIKHAAQTKIFQLAQRRKTQMNIAVGFAKTQEFVGF